MDLAGAIQKVMRGNDLSREEMAQVMQVTLEGKASPGELADFLKGLSSKGESVEELCGAVEVMRRRMTPFRTPDEAVLDTCGTGGDGSGSINVSTLVALVASGAGASVAKHGNRSVSSRCGSADLFEALGVKIDLPVPIAERVLEEVGIVFLFAPLYHPAMKNVAQVRKELGIRTIFNLLGPLSNPAGATHQLVGVFSPVWLRPMASVLGGLGSKHVLAVHGNDGLDEVSISASTRVCEWNRGELSEYEISPEQFGMKRVPGSETKGGDVSRNKEIALKVLRGEKGSYRDLVLLNTGAALYAADQCESIQEGIGIARKSIDSGKALAKLEQLRNFSKGRTGVNAF